MSIRFWCRVSERRMSPLVDVMARVALKHNARFKEPAEELAIEVLVSSPVIEVLGEPVLPRRTRPDEEGAQRHFDNRTGQRAEGFRSIRQRIHAGRFVFADRTVPNVSELDIRPEKALEVGETVRANVRAVIGWMKQTLI